MFGRVYQMENRKRERGKNYLEVEKYTLLEIVQKYFHIIENKKTDDGNAKRKKEAWDAIAYKYNCSQQSGQRTGVHLKLLYENIKQKAKKEKADSKIETYRTGGGVANAKISGVSQRFLEISETVDIEISNMYDSVAPMDTLAPDVADLPIIFHGDDVTEMVGTENVVEEGNLLFLPSTSEISTPLIEAGQKSPTIKAKDKTPMVRRQGKINKHANIKENLKEEILKIRLEKEKLQRDLLILENEEKLIQIKKQKLELKILAKKENIDVDSI